MIGLELLNLSLFGRGSFLLLAPLLDSANASTT
jgi:hypothetical protein